MVEAGLSGTSALTRVTWPGPVSGIITSDSAFGGSLLARRAFCTLSGAGVRTASLAWTASGAMRKASSRGRRVENIGTFMGVEGQQGRLRQSVQYAALRAAQGVFRGARPAP